MHGWPNSGKDQSETQQHKPGVRFRGYDENEILLTVREPLNWIIR